jgi:hypothetical protein
MKQSSSDNRWSLDESSISNDNTTVNTGFAFTSSQQTLSFIDDYNQEDDENALFDPSNPNAEDINIDALLSAPKYPLEYKWTMWYNAPPKRGEGWPLKQVYTFDTIQDFWSVINNLVPPSQLSSGSNYHLFKHGIQPEWEDAHNIKGGKWILDVPRHETELFDNQWMWMMLSLVGNHFNDEEGDITGAVVSPRTKVIHERKKQNQKHTCTFIHSICSLSLFMVSFQMHESFSLHTCTFDLIGRFMIQCFLALSLLTLFLI